MIRRFRVEAEAAARLEHPNIVPIYEINEECGRQYFSMKLITGENLAEKIRSGHRFNSAEIARLIATLAKAVHHAHQHGVLHRDLKPSNVLIDADHQPWISDFSVAKLSDPDPAAVRSYDLTQSGSVLGTPNYMAPEQAKGDHVTTAADIYSLGAILYELLTGRPPFHAATPLETLRQVVEVEPVAPKTLNALADSDLATICLKCLEKDPHRRYPTALAVAEDLDRFLLGEAITARPARAAEKVIRWCRRNPAMATALGALMIVFLAGFAAVTWQWRRAEQLAFESRRDEYFAQMNRAFMQLHEGKVAEAKQLLEQQIPKGREKDFRNWEWRHAWLRCRTDELYTLGNHDEGIVALAITQDGRTLASGGGRLVKIWDLNTRKEVTTLIQSNVVRSVAFCGGELLVLSADGDVSFWDFAKLERLRTISHNSPARSSAISPDGRYLAVSGADSLSLWKLDDKHEVKRFHIGTSLGSGGPVDSLLIGGVAFAHDSTVLAYSTEDGTILVRNTATGEQIAKLEGHDAFVQSLAFSPSGRFLVSGGFDQTVRAWNLETKTQVKELNFGAWVADVVFSPDGSTFAVAGADQRFNVFNAETFESLKTYTGHASEVWSVLFTSDGLNLITGSRDKTIKIWPAHTAAIRESLRLSADLVEAFWPPGADQMYMLHSDQTFSLLRFNPLQLSGRFSLPIKGVASSTVSLDGKTSAGATTNQVKLFNLTSGQWINESRIPLSQIFDLTFIGDSRRLGGRAKNNNYYIWHVKELDKPLVVPLHAQPIRTIEFSRQGNVLGVAHSGGLITAWDANSGALVESFVCNFEANAICLSRDERLLAIAANDGKVYLRDIVLKQTVGTMAGQLSAYAGVGFSADDRRLAASGIDGSITIWDTETLEQVAALKLQQYPLSGLDFLADEDDSLAIYGSRQFFLLRAPRK